MEVVKDKYRKTIKLLKLMWSIDSTPIRQLFPKCIFGACSLYHRQTDKQVVRQKKQQTNTHT